MNNVYKAPEAVITETRKGNKLVAVIIGVAVDFGLTSIGGVVLGVVIGVILGKQGIPPSQIQLEMQKRMPEIMSSELGYAFIAFGTFASFLGSYLAARYSNDREYIIASTLAVISVGVAFSVEKQTTELVHGLLTFLGVAVIYIGAYVHVRKKI
jgi:hypothetical protein